MRFNDDISRIVEVNSKEFFDHSSAVLSLCEPYTPFEVSSISYDELTNVAIHACYHFSNAVHCATIHWELNGKRYYLIIESRFNGDGELYSSEAKATVFNAETGKHLVSALILDYYMDEDQPCEGYDDFITFISL